MASCDTDDIESFTFVWRIENFRNCLHQRGDTLQSPIFCLKTFCNTKWCLRLYLKGEKQGDENRMPCYLRRENDDGPDRIGIYFILSLNSMMYEGIFYEFAKENGRGYRDFASCIFHELSGDNNFVIQCDVSMATPNPTAVLSRRSADSLLPSFMKSVSPIPELLKEITSTSERELLKVQKRMWTYPRRGFARSRISVEKRSFSFPVSNSLYCGSNRQQIPALSFTEFPSLLVTLLSSNKSDEEVLKIDICLMGANLTSNLLLLCKMHIFGSNGEIDKTSKDDHLFRPEHSNEIWHYKHGFNLSDFREREDTGYVTQVNCEFEFSNGQISAEMEWTTDVDCNSKTAERPPACGVLREMLRFHTEKKFCDVTLLSKEKEFGAHKAVLCAVSPVFAAMFENNMQESKTNVVDISDIDPDTLSKMLHFMYTETTEELEFESAVKLFAAADKYQIVTLMEVCRNVLEDSLDISNICAVLLLTDKHCDDKLRESVIEFLCIHKNAALMSDEWELFMWENVQLANEILLKLCLKLR